MSSARKVAVKVLLEVEREGSYSNIAADVAIKEANLNSNDSKLASMLIYGVLQRKITLDKILKDMAGSGFSKTHPFVLSVLRVGAYQLLFMDKIPESAAVNESVKIVKSSKQNFASGFTNAVLRKIAKSKNEILKVIEDSDDLGFKYSCSNELAESLIKDYGVELAQGYLKSSLESPKLYCRKNDFVDYEGLSEALTEKGIECKEALLDGAFTLKGAGSVERLPEFRDGKFFVQDLASQIAISNFDIKDGMSVLDVCAAPGGKSFTAAQYVGKTGKIVSCDLYEKRAGLIENGAKRLNIGNLTAFQNDATVYNEALGQFDRVLCDVPCSGFGVIRRKPEIKYKSLDEFSELPSIQLEILKTSVKYLKSDGQIVYS
ncbi:MAG: 16S rRNA (cytosine(967)-C(5))-methyltransferase RsmB, partial [Clostridia bacterium]|nr:16S rRNA (cytosine(967)-C(5))-methyltransferase RsmB [Clostridia bacterium]